MTEDSHGQAPFLLFARIPPIEVLPTTYADFYGEKAVKEAGRMRLEGKDYIMQDGDICYFRFNV